jgi:hypothetical protein
MYCTWELNSYRRTMTTHFKLFLLPDNTGQQAPQQIRLHLHLCIPLHQHLSEVILQPVVKIVRRKGCMGGGEVRIKNY